MLLFVTLGIVYFAFMMFGALHDPGARRRLEARRAGTRPQVAEKKLVTTASVSAANAIRTPQFWLLWVVLFCNVTAGIGILEQAAPMIQDFFRDRTARRASARPPPAASSGCCRWPTWPAGSSGRATSDGIGRKPIYMVYLGVGMVALRAAGDGRARARWPCSCCSPR